MVRTDRRPRRRLSPDPRRAAILEAVAAAPATHPYAEVTISSITAEAYPSNALVYRYFANEEDLYMEVVWVAIADLLTRQTETLDTLLDRVPVRDRVRAATMVYLDHVATHPDAWTTLMRQPGGEPAAVAKLQARIRCNYVKRLQDLLIPNTQARHGYALWGYFGFINAAALRWVSKDCPEKDRWTLIDAALDALEEALGDWAA